MYGMNTDRKRSPDYRAIEVQNYITITKIKCVNNEPLSGLASEQNKLCPLQIQLARRD